MEKLGDQLRRAVNECGLSRNELCRRTGINKGNFSRFMAGTAGLSLQSLEDLAEVLGFEGRARKGGAK
jgi:transcriptional regulator with XRE-family HTH domain